MEDEFLTKITGETDDFEDVAFAEDDEEETTLGGDDEELEEGDDDATEVTTEEEDDADADVAEDDGINI